VWQVAKHAVAQIRDTWATFKETISDDELVAVLDRHMGEVPLLQLR
jgi:hypothetical protein